MTFPRFSIWSLALLIGLLFVSLFLWLDSHLGYKAEATVLVQSKSALYEQGELVETVTGFAKTGQFVKRTVASDRLQASSFSELSEAQQITFLVKKVTATGGKEGGLVRVAVQDKDIERATIVNEESIETLLRMTSFYYPVGKDIDVRIIDQPATKRSLYSPVLYAAKSGASALLAFFFIELLLSFFAIGGQKMKTFRFFKKGTPVAQADEQGATKDMFVPQKVDPKFLYGEASGEQETVVTEELPIQPKASEVVNKEVYGMYEGSGLASVSVAMEDLPFQFETSAEESLAGNLSEHPLEAYILSQEKQEDAPEAEPSVLEYKKRLNELLAQK
jgi:capsular polysaccharide biosynthesis protein